MFNSILFLKNIIFFFKFFLFFISLKSSFFNFFSFHMNYNSAVFFLSLQIENDLPFSNTISVQSDLFYFDIDLNGGDICYLRLLKYFDDDNSDSFLFFNMTSCRYYYPQSGILRPTDSISYRLLFTCKEKNFCLKDSENSLYVDLVYTYPDAVCFTKRFVVERNSYIIKIIFIIKNNSNKLFYGKSFYRLVRRYVEKNGLFSGVVGSFVGAAVNTKDSVYKKIFFKSLENNMFQQIYNFGWFAMVERYFISLWLPISSYEKYYVGEYLGTNIYSVSCFEKIPFIVNCAEIKECSAKLYVGPKVVSRLKNFYDGVDLAVDYGIFWPIAKVIFFLLLKINSYINNWGFSIIIITIFIKFLFYPLSYVSYKSMVKIKQLQPKIDELKNTFSTNSNKFNTELMLLYKRENVNPLSGCFPTLIQIPVFISLYYVILEAIEFRKAYFLLWIHDLSSHDPFFVLPIIMGFSMFLQQLLLPTTTTALQRKVMLFLPLVLVFFFIKFPAGLVLYWIVSNFLSICQQLIVLRKMRV